MTFQDGTCQPVLHLFGLLKRVLSFVACKSSNATWQTKTRANLCGEFLENTAKYGENAFTKKSTVLEWPVTSGRMQEVEYRILMWTLSPEQRKRATGLEKGPWADLGDEQLRGGGVAFLDKPMSGFAVGILGLWMMWM